jgi:hypothetical protein
MSDWGLPASAGDKAGLDLPHEQIKQIVVRRSQRRIMNLLG